MGCCGMGITQSDEYCEIYERFMEEYDDGKPVADIKKDILDEYLEEFDEEDGILHDVYFALGKAEWMCGGISNDIYEKISYIIKSGENIAYYRELEATEKDLRLRQKNLEKFLESISVDRGKTKKRKVSVEKYVKIEKAKLPDFKCGDIFAYETQGKYRVVCFVNRSRFLDTYATYCYAFSKLFVEIPMIDVLTKEYIIPLGYFTAETFPPMEKLSFIGNIPEFKKLNIPYPSVITEKWKPATFAIAKEENLSENYPLDLCMKYSECIEKIEKLK